MIMQPLPQETYELLPYAEQEGWNLFWRFGTGWSIERVQEPDDGLPEIPSDKAAWEHVWRNALQDSPLHVTVLWYLQKTNLHHWQTIRRHCQRPQP